MSTPWITSVDQVPTASPEALRRTLLTCDGAGTAVKTAALDELLARAGDHATIGQEPPAPTVPCDLAGFRKLADEFLRALPTLTSAEAVEAGESCLNLAFVGLRGSVADVELAISVRDYVLRQAIVRECFLRRVAQTP